MKTMYRLFNVIALDKRGENIGGLYVARCYDEAIEKFQKTNEGLPYYFETAFVIDEIDGFKITIEENININ